MQTARAALEQAQQAFDQGRYLETQAHLARFEKLASPTINPLLRIDAKALAASLHLASGDLAMARQLAEEHAADLARQSRRFNTTSLQLQQQLSETFFGDLETQEANTAAAERRYLSALKIPGGQRGVDPLWETQTRIKLSEHQAEPVSHQTLRAARDALRDELATWRQKNWHSDIRAEASLLLAEISQRLNEEPQALTFLDAGLADRSSTPSQQIDLRLAQANCLQRMKQRPAALQALDKAQELLSPEAKDKLAEILSARAAILAAEGNRAQAEAVWKQALAAYQNSLASRAHDRGKDARAGNRIETWQRLLAVLRNLESWPEGIEAAQELLVERQRALLAGDTNIERSKASLASLRALASLDARSSAALAKVDPALSRPKQIERAQEELRGMLQTWSARPQQFPIERFRALSNLVELARFRGEFSQATAYAREGRQLLEKLQGNKKVSALERAVFRLNAGSVLAGLGRYYEASADYNQAILDLDAGEHALPWKATEIKSLVYLNIAMLERSQGRPDDAIAPAQKALELWESTGSTRLELKVPYYLSLGNIELARFEKLNAEPDTRARRESAPRRDDALAQAVRWAEQATQIIKDHQLADNPVAIQVNHLRAQTLFNLHLQDRQRAVAPADDVRLEQAAAAWKAMEELAGQLGLEVEVARSLSFQLELVTSRRGWDADAALREAAERLSSQAAATAKNLSAFPNLRCQVLLQRAQVLFKLSREDANTIHRPFITEAIELLKEAVQLVELPRASTTGADAERADFYAHFAPIFDMLVDAYLAAGQQDKALQATEWRRNRTLRDQVLVARAREGKKAEDGPEAQLVQSLREEFAKARTLALASEVLSETNTEQIAETNRQAERFRSDLVALRARLHQHDPFIRSILDQTEVEDHGTSLRAFQDLFPPGNADARGPVVLVYHIGQRWSHLFLVTQGKAPLECFPLIVDESASALGVSPGPLGTETARDLVQHMVDTATRAADWGKTHEQATGTQAVSAPRGLYNADERIAVSDLLLPREALRRLRQLKPTRIVVIPDGPLHELPLELLQTARDEFLLDVLPPICYAPSALIQQTIQNRDPAPASQLLLTVAPVYPKSIEAPAVAAQDVSRGLPRFEDLRELKHSSDESRGVRELFAQAGLPGSVQSLPTGNLPVSEAEVKARVKGVRFLHFAAHGHVAETFKNLFGGLIVSRPDPDNPVADDGILSLYDIEQLSLSSCELAILSACRTNRGVPRPLEAGSTLARAFLASGAQRVVCSHWDVDDESTRDLMLEFVRRITDDLQAGRAVDYASALHEAKRHVRKKWPSPRHWAPFVLIGPAVGPSSTPNHPSSQTSADARR